MERFSWIMQVGLKCNQMYPYKRKAEGEFFFFNFNWRLITSQYCGGFCYTFTWISHGCTCVPHPEPPFHLPSYPTPQGRPSAPALSTLSYALNLDWLFVEEIVHRSEEPCLLFRPLLYALYEYLHWLTQFCPILFYFIFVPEVCHVFPSTHLPLNHQQETKFVEYQAHS